VRIEPGRDQDRHGVVDLPTKGRRVVLHRDRVQIDQAIDAVPTLLALDVLTPPADEVAEVLAARRLDPREDPGSPAGARRRVAHDAAMIAPGTAGSGSVSRGSRCRPPGCRPR